MRKCNVVTKDGLAICVDCENHHEAMMCIAELIKLDKQDGVFQQGYYKIVDQ